MNRYCINIDINKAYIDISRYSVMVRIIVFSIVPTKFDVIIVFDLFSACRVDIIGPWIYVNRNIGAAIIRY